MGESLDEKYIRRTFDLASNGLGTTSPNPLVGAVIVHDDRIIGEGFHHHLGGPHAEVVALANVKKKELLADSTIYVNLEPCAHHGLTPPCTSAILESGIKRVVVANRDPNPKVKESESILTGAGIDVTYGVLESEGQHLNRRFFTRLRHNRPWVILKWAQSPDGFMDVDRSYGNLGPAWITDKRTKVLTHQWRVDEDAILVGAQTVVNDNPLLTARAVQGQQPLRVLIDPDLRCRKDRAIFNDEAKTVVFNGIREDIDGDRQLWIIDKHEPIVPQILARLAHHEINSLIVEGGRVTLQHFIESGLWDEARILTGSQPIEGHVRAPQIEGELWQNFEFGPDRVEIFGRR